MTTSQTKGKIMKLTASQIFVDDQQKALDFYTQILGFKKKKIFH